MEIGGDIFGADTDEEKEDDDDKAPDGTAPEAAAEFTVFLSFSSKQAAESWLTAQGIEGEFSAGRTLIIRMEGQ